MRLGGIIFEGDTAFSHYTIEDMFYAGRPARVLFSGAHDAAQSGVALDGNDELLFDYNQVFRSLVRGLQPKRILVLGGGAFTLPTALAHEFPDMDITVVELDEALIGIAERYFDFRPDPHTKVHIGDARRFIDTSAETFDVVIVDVFSHDEVPGSFLTAAAAQDLRRCLTKRGTVAANIIAPSQGRRSGMLYRLHENMQANFRNVQVFPAKRALSPWSAQNHIVAASDSTTDFAPFVGYAPVW